MAELRIAKSLVAEVLIVMGFLFCLFVLAANVHGKAADQGGIAAPRRGENQPAPFHRLTPPF